MKKKMQIDQFVELAAAVVQSLPRDMDTTTGQSWITNRDALAKALRQTLMPSVAQKSESSLLTLIGTVKVQPTKRFVARDFFKVNTKKTAPVKISYLSNNFKELFLDKGEERPSASEAIPGDGPYRTPGVQNNNTEIALRYQTLNQGSVDGPIIVELGGENRSETTLAEVFALMQKQANSEQGALLINGCANIFYVRDASGVLCAVGVHWDGDGWRVGACSVGNPDEWYAGCRVFSR